MATVAELLKQRDRLAAVSDSAALDVELLLCHCLDKPRSFLRAWPERVVDANAEQQFKQLMARREQGEPIAYLTGVRGFWTLDLEVSPATLIPRADTECLVEWALELIADKTTARVLDLGTGTGAIALALASEHPAWQVVGCDVQADAVALAEHNRQRLGLTNVQFLQSNWFDDIALRDFDLIVSNPPYIDPDDPHLQQGDVRFEPRSALVAGQQGLADIKTIVATASEYLLPGGWLLLEHGYDQGPPARQLLAAAGFTMVKTVRDLAGHDRVSGGRCQRSDSDE